MRSFILIGGLLLAAAIGCKKKPGGGDDPKPPEVGPPVLVSKAELPPPSRPPAGKPPAPAPVPVEPTEPDPWPELPPVPSKAADYPATPGGSVARALDYAADQFMTVPQPPGNVLWTDWNIVKAFKDIGTVLNPAYPRKVISRGLDADIHGPAGNATADRDRIDAAFARVWASWHHYRERDRRWRVAASEAVHQKRNPTLTLRQARASAERGLPPGREVRIGNAELNRPTTMPSDWVVLEVTGDSGGGTVNEAQTTAVGGRVDYRKTFELNVGPAAVTLQGRAGSDLRLLANAPLFIDLVDFQTPLANIRANGDALVRVGPGVAVVRLSIPRTRRGLILARNAPNLRVELPEERATTAVVNY